MVRMTIVWQRSTRPSQRSLHPQSAWRSSLNSSSLQRPRQSSASSIVVSAARPRQKCWKTVQFLATLVRRSNPVCGLRSSIAPAALPSAPTVQRAKRAPHSPAATPEEALHWLPRLLMDQALERHRACPQRLARKSQLQSIPLSNQLRPRLALAAPQIRKHLPAARPTPLATRFQTYDAPPFPKARRTNPPLQEAARKPRSTSAARLQSGRRPSIAREVRRT